LIKIFHGNSSPSFKGFFRISFILYQFLTVETTDRDIWLYAKENGFAIISKDDDFEQRSVLLGHPPKVIWLRLGNCTTKQIVVLLQRFEKTIYAFNDDEEKSILPIP